MKPQQIRYHINPETGAEDQSLGIVIDWKMIEKAYDKLKIPEAYHKPHMQGIDHLGYIIDLSDRSRGKTTNKLILGLLLYMAYGVQLHYIRQSSEQCELRNIKNLYSTVLDCGYIEKITEGKYNHLNYRGRRWYLQLLDDDGKVLESDPIACCVCFGLDDAPAQKSIYNAPKGDMIFFDEFISPIYRYNDYTLFSDLCKTIIRDRISPVIFMSANTIDKQSQWFDELCIRDQIEHLHQGESTETVTSLGTHLYIEILGQDTSVKRAQVNRRFFGFDTKRLSAITGKGEWTTDDYPHIPPSDDDHPVRIILNRIFVERQGRLIKLQVVKSPQHGLCVHAIPATKLYDDSIIFTADDLSDDRYLFCFGTGTGVGFVWDLYLQGRFRYAHNEAGAFIKSYVSYAKSKLAAMRR